MKLPLVVPGSIHEIAALLAGCGRLSVITIVLMAAVPFASPAQPGLTFEQLFPKAKQHQMGLDKLSGAEKEALRVHVEGMLTRAISARNSDGSGETARMAKVYSGGSSGHWIKKNIDSGSYMTLEDGSLWQIDPLEKIDASIWLPISNITVIKDENGSPGYDYLLINTDDAEKAHAKYLGHE